MRDTRGDEDASNWRAMCGATSDGCECAGLPLVSNYGSVMTLLKKKEAMTAQQLAGWVKSATIEALRGGAAEAVVSCCPGCNEDQVRREIAYILHVAYQVAVKDKLARDQKLSAHDAASRGCSAALVDEGLWVADEFADRWDRMIPLMELEFAKHERPRLYRAAGAHLRESVFRADDVASLNLQQRAAWNAVEELFIARLEAAEKLLRSTRLV
jgi:hypothetical protein